MKFLLESPHRLAERFPGARQLRSKLLDKIDVARGLRAAADARSALAERGGSESVLIVRTEALGDMLWGTAAAELYQEAHPDCEVTFLTHLRYKPITDRLESSLRVFHIRPKRHDIRRVFDGSFDRIASLHHPLPETGRHMLEDYCQALEIDFEQRDPKMKPVTGDRLDTPTILVHLGVSWPVRMVDAQVINKALAILELDTTHEIIQIGLGGSPTGLIEGATNLIDRLSIDKLCRAIGKASLFIGIDSGPLHIATAMRIPAIGLFTSTNARLRMSLETSPSFVTPDLPCIGCHHQNPCGHERASCRNNLICQSAISPEELASKINDYLCVANA